MNKARTLPEQLKAYSLLAGSFLASTVAAHAQVHYTDVIPDRELGGFNPGSFPYTDTDTLDLNNDGVFDFKFIMKMYGMTGSDFFFREKIDGSFNPLNGIITYTVEYRPVPLKLDLCDSVPPPYLYGFNHAYLAYQLANSVGYFWQDIHDKYVGLIFRIGNETHYGWVRLDVNTMAPIPNIIIKDYAYEETPDKKIAVCDTGLGSANSVALISDPGSFGVFPNPSAGTCVIKPGNSFNSDMDILVTDALGNEVFREMIPASHQVNELPFNFSHFAPGMYFIQLKTSSGTFTEKWIRN